MLKPTVSKPRNVRAVCVRAERLIYDLLGYVFILRKTEKKTTIMVWSPPDDARMRRGGNASAKFGIRKKELQLVK